MLRQCRKKGVFYERIYKTCKRITARAEGYSVHSRARYFLQRVPSCKRRGQKRRAVDSARRAYRNTRRILHVDTRFNLGSFKRARFYARPHLSGLSV